MSIQEFEQIAVDIQNASNPRAVVRVLGEWLACASQHGIGSAHALRHTVAALLLDKLCDMAGR